MNLCLIPRLRVLALWSVYVLPVSWVLSSVCVNVSVFVCVCQPCDELVTLTQLTLGTFKTHPTLSNTAKVNG